MAVVLVTGANRGIGLEFVRQMAARGDVVLAACRRPAQAEALHALAARHPGQVHLLAVDVAAPESIRQMAQQAAALTSHLDGLINNAGVIVRDEHITRLRAEHLQRAFAVNAVGPMLVVQALLPLLRRGTRPLICNLSTTLASLTNKTYGGFYSYGGSKAALNLMSRALAAELREEGIIVLLVHPGWVRTDMGGPNATLSVEESVQGMLALMARATLEDSGRFFAWNGDLMPW